MLADAELLRRYVDANSEAAFHELVRRHANLVYAAALRQTCGDTHLAEEVGQRVFTALARKAAALTRHPTLVGWLHRTTRFAAIDAVRARQRRQAHEREAETMNECPDGERVEWERLQPLLDEALDDLNETDRTAVLLRFFEGRSFGELGASLGLTENAARMRVERSLEKLRRILAQRGCTSTASALGLLVSSHAAPAAPEAWVVTLAPQALASAASGAGVAAGASLLAMNKLTIAAITGIAAAGLTTAGLTWKNRWTQRENAVLRADNEALRQLKSTHEATATGDGPSLGAVADREKLAALSARVQENSAAKNAATAAAKSQKPALQNRGMGAPMEAIETFAWACYTGDVAAIARQIHFDGDGRARAEAKLAEMPEFLRRQYKTPEELYAFFTAADALVYPPPSDPALLEKIETVFLKSDRIEMRVRGSSRGRQQYQWTTDGWKMAYPEQAVDDLPNQVLRENPMPEPTGSS
ncbi:RNA polymerase sigma factor [Opitutus terrae]|uniref:RNA polymerase, sigma-24 subunit, ECF subfamily n=1 Tax=Opitutus terrae (strain DSM 11246 / JCM 15787 / PB90-1) TaxID=452637 RepID=B2A097_OPITP|nr:sigma-70 family RNA polymerase sigma factor [Opitutus terrae]ACB77436.1 RNA polymerase, sigma-24 subunit, ECF subfamily [Opitutus terrae PB90-1]